MVFRLNKLGVGGMQNIQLDPFVNELFGGKRVIRKAKEGSGVNDAT